MLQNNLSTHYIERITPTSRFHCAVIRCLGAVFTVLFRLFLIHFYLFVVPGHTQHHDDFCHSSLHIKQRR